MAKIQRGANRTSLKMPRPVPLTFQGTSSLLAAMSAALVWLRCLPSRRAVC